MKDNYMILVLLAIMLTPFFPILLKSKCPVCKKKKLEHLESVNTATEGQKQNFITYYRCHNCNNEFERVRSGPLKQVEILNKETSEESEEPDLVNA